MTQAAQAQRFLIKDDPDPTGTGRVGRSVGLDLSKTKIAVCDVVWQDRETEVDVYENAGKLLLVFYCPQCTNTLQVQQDKKRFELHERGVRGVLSTEPIKCSYPGCSWWVRIDRNHACNHRP